MNIFWKSCLGFALLGALYCGPEVLPDRTGGAFWLTPEGTAVAAAATGGGAVVPVPSVTEKPRIFATAIAYNGNLGGVAGADAKCMADGLRPTTGTYKAMLVDDVNRRACSTMDCSGGVSENIDWVFRANQLYFQADGLVAILTTNSAGIHDFGMANLGNPAAPGSFQYWTGLVSDWRTNSQVCSNWSSNMDPLQGMTGEAGQVTGNAIQDDPDDCDSFARILCVEQ